MLSTRRLQFLGGAIVLSGATVFLTQQWLQGAVTRATVSARAEAAAPARLRVLVAAQPLSAGTILKPEHLREQPWPADVPVADYLMAPASSPAQMAGAVVRTDMAAGEPLSATRVVQPGERSFLAAVLKPGYRAVTINVSPSTGVAGFVFPDDHVDLILSRSLDGTGAKRFVSETVLSDVRVVAVDQRSSSEKKDVLVPQTATLEVTPRQAEVVTLVTELGKLSLSLRSLATPEDAAPARVTRTWDYEATQISSQRPAAAPAAPRPSARPAPAPAAVMVVRGTSVGASQ